MMKFLRNPEIRTGLILHAAATLLVTFAAWLYDSSLWTAAFAIGVLFTLLHLTITFIRYRKISALSADIDKILHSNARISLEKYSEGELAVLQSEISKMTVRLREQQQQLVDDKVLLADSLADISHQIRTPLTSINLLASMLSEPNISEEQRIRLSQEMFALLSRIEWLITALLKISKLDAGTVEFKKENTTLKELLDRSVEPLLIPIELKEQRLTLSAEGNFAGDLSWTCEALGNIIKNCMEHTPDGGSIDITAAENALFSEIVISDSGCGIAKEDLPHVFERFYKGKNSVDKSFGIGLALARTIISAQNGSIKAENLPSKGARFTIRFFKGTF
ncbi:MAG: HAMP domain-containing histidine kinase [Oscillospiraceae bacterium]|nr:HAMP domain-containing histidine kinase [Oscillospiraceae bacterium]